MNDVLRIRGGRRLAGTVETSGFKHLLVTTVASALAGTAPVRIANCPDIVESRVLAEIVRNLGGHAEFCDGVLTVDAGRLTAPHVDQTAAGRIHGVVYLVPALLARFGKTRIPNPGGCRLEKGRGRPVDQYVDVLERFGASVWQMADGTLEAVANQLRGCEIDLLDFTSDRRLRSGPRYSGASKMALLAAVVSVGRTVLRNIYPKPDVIDILDLLGLLGAEVERLPDGAVVINGRGPEVLDRPADFVLPPDLIEVFTWCTAGAVFGEVPITVRGQGMERAVRALAPEFEVLDRMGVQIFTGTDELVVHPAGRLRPVDLEISSHGVYSDNQPFVSLLATFATGRSRITDTVWRDRFGHIEGLTALGCEIRRQDGGAVVVQGPRPPVHPGRLYAPDLRAAAVLLLAATTVDGESVLTGASHLARGYPDLAGTFRTLGSDVTEFNEGE